MTITILTIEDDDLTQKVLGKYLEDFDAEQIQAGDAEEGLKVARQHQPDLIFMDMIMPGLNGWEALPQYKADPIVGKIPIVCMTNNSIIESEGEDTFADFDAIMLKPFATNDIARVIKKLL